LSDIGISLLALDAFVASGKPSSGLNGFIAFEKFRGETRAGLFSTLLSSVLERIGCSEAFYSRSFFVVGDSTDAIQPNRPPKVERGEPVIGGGLAHAGVDLQGLGATLGARNRIVRMAAELDIPLQEIVSRKLPNPTGVAAYITAMFGFVTETIAIPVISRLSVRELAAAVDFERAFRLFEVLYGNKTD
jgi:aspartyl aminopeptidase